MIAKTYTIASPNGFHVRPTKTFVERATEFPCQISVSCKGKKVNGKSSLSMLTLGIKQGDEVTLEIDGEREAEALEALGAILTQINE